MATSSGMVTFGGWTAENDLSTKQFYAVETGTNAGEVDVCDGATDLVVGILQNDPTAGQACEVAIGGIAKAIAGGTISRGNRVGTDSSGKLVAKTSDADLVCGIAVDAAVTDDIFRVLLTLNCQRAS